MNLQINDYLDFITIKNGRFHTHVSKVYVKKAISEISNHYMRIAMLRGLKFYYKVDENFPNQAGIDKERMQQIVSNLISNAIRHTESKIEVHLSVC